MFEIEQRIGAVARCALSMVLGSLLVARANADGAVDLKAQTLVLPENAGPPLFVDVAGGGLSDLLVVDRVTKSLLRYRQRAHGFSNAPDQIIPLPPQTAWVAVADVDPNPGPELLFSTGRGVFYSRQNGGVFESEPRMLIEAAQVFTNFDFPVLTALATNKSDTNIAIPVMSAGQIIQYRRDRDYHWKPEAPKALSAKLARWIDNHGDWALGANTAHAVWSRQSFRVPSERDDSGEAENASLRRIVEDMRSKPYAGLIHTNRLDINGDGREDLVLWQVAIKMDLKTDLYIFLRGADQRLPERPTQVLHESGAPIPIGADGGETSPLSDLKGDGGCELVLLNYKTALTSASGLIETVITRGVEFSLGVRQFHHGAFPTSAEAGVSFTAILPSELLDEWPFFIMGDFNGDGRADLVVRRTDAQWQVFPSTADGHWFASPPALTFSAPVHGYMEITDLKGDGQADVIWHEPGESRLSIFLSPRRQAQGKKP